MKEMLEKLVQFWAATDSLITPTADILDWIRRRNREAMVEIHRVTLPERDDWFYSPEEGVLRNQHGTFFRVSGLRT